MKISVELHVSMSVVTLLFTNVILQINYDYKSTNAIYVYSLSLFEIFLKRCAKFFGIFYKFLFTLLNRLFACDSWYKGSDFINHIQ